MGEQIVIKTVHINFGNMKVWGKMLKTWLLLTENISAISILLFRKSFLITFLLPIKWFIFWITSSLCIFIVILDHKTNKVARATQIDSTRCSSQPCFIEVCARNNIVYYWFSFVNSKEKSYITIIFYRFGHHFLVCICLSTRSITLRIIVLVHL